MSQFRNEKGFLWPDYDIECAAVIFRSLNDLERLLEHVSDFSVAVQAGGNCGVWPKAMAARFERVYTFEPDPENFHCLDQNISELNVVKKHAALGNVKKNVTMDRFAHNCGAHQISDRVGSIPICRIDDLKLEQCGLICLDVEGYEMEALRGGRDLIAKCRPVISIEDKGLCVRYGTQRGDIQMWLQEEFGYRVADHIERDVVLV